MLKFLKYFSSGNFYQYIEIGKNDVVNINITYGCFLDSALFILTTIEAVERKYASIQFFFELFNW